ncbi:MAG: hypothetical protein ACKO2N_09405, partial [Tabrizicola sp.]
PLADRFGNPAPDGTAVTAILRHADGSFSLAHGFALQDSAAARFIARDIPGLAEASITLGRQLTEPLPLTVEAPSSAGLPEVALAALPDIDATRLRLGPFLTSDGYALSDGVQVTVTVTFAAGEELTETAWIVDGEVDLLLPFGTASKLRLVTVSSSLGLMDLTSQWQRAARALAAGPEGKP